MKKIVIISGMLASLAGNAFAMHPLVTDDTGFVGKGVIQVETGFEHSVLDAGRSDYEGSVGVELAYGVTDTIDALVSMPWQYLHADGEKFNGHGDMAGEVKFRVAEKAGWTLALKPGFSIPTGEESKGMSTNDPGYWLNMVMGRSSGVWQYYLNTGWMYNGNTLGERKSIFNASAAAVLEAFPGVLLGLDLSVETNTDPDAASHPVSSVIGVVWTPCEWLDLDAGFKLGLNDEADHRGFLAGATVRF